jgi:hypothetical protein
MPRNATSKKRVNDGEELKQSHKPDSNKKREEASVRIVRREDGRFASTKKVKEEEKKGEPPERNLPVADYDNLTVDQVSQKLDSLSREELERVKSYEQEHKKRRTLIEQLNVELSKEPREITSEFGVTANWNWILVGAGALIVLWLIL